MNQTNFELIASNAFTKISERFPFLVMTREEDPECEISIPIPIQEGIYQEVWLGLFGDELIISIGKNFWMEWIAIDRAGVAERYIEAVCGYLSGEYRVLEHYKNERCTKAELQKPANNEWKTIATWVRIDFDIFTKKTFKEIYNRPKA